MTTIKKELAVAALENGTVIDRIPSEQLFKVVSMLKLDTIPNSQAHQSPHLQYG